MAPKAKEAARVPPSVAERARISGQVMPTLLKGRAHYTEKQELAVVSKWNELVDYTARVGGKPKGDKITSLQTILPIHPFLSDKLASGDAHAIPELTEAEVAKQPEQNRQANKTVKRKDKLEKEIGDEREQKMARVEAKEEELEAEKQKWEAETEERLKERFKAREDALNKREEAMRKKEKALG